VPDPPNSDGPPPEEPTRPEQIRGYDRSGPPSDLQGTQEWANRYDKAVQEHAQRQQPEQPAEKQPEKTEIEQQAYYREMAQDCAPKETSSPEQQRAQALQKQSEQEH
jgi:hypothetical protein